VSIRRLSGLRPGVAPPFPMNALMIVATAPVHVETICEIFRIWLLTRASQAC
jgi:hypothetical protein